ncbi:hypothetical protein LCGC14_0860440 [marine sediment metagenome]|uniref:Uncharacterized protein n=1 Tax=marine sediment metagenome TaxID=412755 RepID=A0A0F9SEM0_9ZZZZ
MAQFTALRHTWDFAESVIADDFIVTSENLDAANQVAREICWDGTFFYIVDSDANVYKYNSAWVFQASFALDAANQNPQGICWDGTFFYVVDTTDKKVYKYNAAWAIQANFNLNVANQNPVGIEWDGTFFYVVDPVDGKVYKYNTAFVLQASFSTVYSNLTITWDGTYFYIGKSSGNIYKYDTNWVFQESYNSYPDNTNAYGLCWDGTYFYLTDNLDNKVYRYRFPLTKTVAGHNDAVVLYDGMKATLAPINQMTGNFEFWLRAIDATSKVQIILKDGADNACINISIDTDKIIGDGTDALDPALDGVWYLIRIDFDCTPNTYDLYINGNLELNDQAFGVNDDGTGIDYVEFSITTDKNGYMDGIGHDWDVGYTQGDNATDTVDVTADITYSKIIEELGMDSWAELKIKGTAVTDFESGHEISFYDSDGVLSWSGIILFPETVLEGVSETIGKMTLLGLNFKFNNTYRKNFTTVRDSDYIIKNIIDNSLTRYHSYDDEIDDFTITYKYDLKTKIQKMYNYLTMLERAVIHYKPESEILFNKYNNLSATGLSWTQATSHVKITAYTPKANRHVTQAPVIGANNSLGQVYYVGRASESEEDQFGINELQPWRDPEITNYTEAKQLGDNLQTIYSLDTQMISMLVVGKKHIQVGYTLQLSWNILFNISLANFLVTKRVWYPINDVCELELTDNILTRKAFNLRVINKFYDEDAQQSYEDPDVSESTVDGTVLTLTSVAELRAGIINNYIHLRDQKANNVGGGAFTSGAWRTRVLNIVATDQLGDVVTRLAANQFTLSAGTYIMYATAPALHVDNHKAKLRNVSDNIDALTGTSEFSGSGAYYACTVSIVSGIITIASEKTFEIQHRCGTTDGLGFGNACNFGVLEEYTDVQLWKVG